MHDCRNVELRAPCNEVPRTPPGPEGSNGTGKAECAAETPKFLELKAVISDLFSVKLSVAFRFGVPSLPPSDTDSPTGAQLVFDKSIHLSVMGPRF